MRTPTAALLVPAIAITLLAGGGPAFADDSVPAANDSTIATAPPDQPEEADLVEGAPDTPAAAPSDTEDEGANVPSGRVCEAGWYYYPTSKKKDYHKGVGAEQSNYNGTPHMAKSTFVSETSGTVGVAFSGELKVTAKSLVTEVEAKWGVNVSVSLTAKIGNTVSADTPSHKTTFGRYGVYRLKSYGYNQYTHANCVKGTKKNATVYTPHRVGWAIWES
ncbi:hypothetical protein PV343_13480 [Streptomyces sp. WI03-4A]|uniref:hypothetical protein n=1 Tax=Streptomyces sp. WI03-4A TaxID=3028706 RepID=UPI0029A97B31|nr:hypothetical protein [Streptomyces sp. WI03-4A]MDX2593240.1 hypothetical protein [Streptomyces sp. WI03-4A]